jgi:hypothetical protein
MLETTNSYQTKIITTNNVIQYYNYSKPIIIGNKSDRENYEKSFYGDKSSKSLQRARNNLFLTIASNVTKYSKFMTLTTKETVLYRESFLKMFKQFQKNFNRIFGYSLKYISVLERQKLRGKKENNLGSWHIHLIVFNSKKIDFEKLKQAWASFGSVDIKKVRHVEQLGVYMIKYLTKDNVQFHKKTILKSQNLIIPNIFHNQYIITPDSFDYNSSYTFYKTDMETFDSLQQREYYKIDVNYYEKHLNKKPLKKPLVLEFNPF